MTIPNAPTGLTVSNTHASVTDPYDQLYCSWTDNTSGTYPHAVLYRENGSGDPFLRVNIPAGTTTHLLTGLDAGTEYDVQVMSYDGGDESARDSATASTAAALQVVNTGGGSAASSVNHTFTRPAGYQAGDMIVYFIAFDSGTSWPGGDPTSSLLNTYDDTPRDVDLFVRYEELIGGESSTWGITLNSARIMAYTAYLIRGHHGQIEGVPASGEVNLSGANPDPGSLTPSWGSAGNLWLAGCAYADGTTTVSGYPSGYDDDQTNERYNTSAGIGVGVAAKVQTATTDNPGTLTLSASEEHVVFTIAVKPLTSGIPSAPSGLAVDGDVDDINVPLAWTDNSSDEDGFYVHRSTSTGFTPTAGTRHSGLLGAGTEEWVNTFAPSDTTLYYVVEAFNASGSSYSSELEVTTAPARPTNVQVAVGDTQLTATFTDQTGGSYPHYAWIRWVGETEWNYAGLVTAGDTSRVFPDLTNDVAHEITFSATNLSEDVESRYAVPAQATPTEPKEEEEPTDVITVSGIRI